MQKIEMIINTVESHYDSSLGIHCYYLSCSLLNIARGRCNIVIVDENSDIEDTITIQHQRAIMSGSIKVKNNFFTSIPYQFSIKNERPAKIELTINTKLNINKNGILFLDRNMTSKIIEYKFYIPFL